MLLRATKDRKKFQNIVKTDINTRNRKDFTGLIEYSLNLSFPSTIL